MSIADSKQLRDVLIQMRPDQFVSTYLLEPVPYVFGDLASWIHWKSEIAAMLEVDPYELVLVGSSAIGFSLNPNKAFSEFHEQSDIDVAVISGHHFDSAWRYLRRSLPSWLTLDKKTRRAISSHQQNYVFSGTIATDRILALLPFAKAWQCAIDHAASVAPTINRDVNLRIYRDYDSLRTYQIRSVEHLRNSLVDHSDHDESIGLEE